jgi:hypothetical protein
MMAGQSMERASAHGANDAAIELDRRERMADPSDAG